MVSCGVAHRVAAAESYRRHLAAVRAQPLAAAFRALAADAGGAVVVTRLFQTAATLAPAPAKAQAQHRQARPAAVSGRSPGRRRTCSRVGVARWRAGEVLPGSLRLQARRSSALAWRRSRHPADENFRLMLALRRTSKASSLIMKRQAASSGRKAARWDTARTTRAAIRLVRPSMSIRSAMACAAGAAKHCRSKRKMSWRQNGVWSPVPTGGVLIRAISVFGVPKRRERR